jgi:hypothetical protein
MKTMTLVLAALALAVTTAVLWQQRSLSTLRASSNRGFTNEVSTGKLATTEPMLEQETKALREQTRDLAKLRSEVGRLRATRAELAMARSESARLLEAKQNAAVAPPLPAGFTSRQQLAHVGFTTPEATVQTFFWALTQGDIETAMQAMSPNSEERKQFDAMPAEQRAAMAGEIKKNGPDKSMERFNNFGVLSREDHSDDLVVLHVGSSLATNTMAMTLQRFGSEWRLQDMPK